MIHSYKSLVERFQMFGLDDRASLLESLLKKLPIKPDIPDILRFLLDLSDSPIHAIWESSSFKFPEKGEMESELTWQAIVRDDPLEGQHWLINEDTVNDDDDYEDKVHSEGTTFEDNSRTSYTHSEKDLRSAKMSHGPTYDRPFTMRELRKIQYWNRPEEQISRVTFEYNQPTTLSPALAYHEQIHVNYFHRPMASTNYVSEMDLIREVLFMLSGGPGNIFQEDVAFSYKIDMRVALTHATSGAIAQMLRKFAEIGSMLARIRSLIKETQNAIKSRRSSKTLEAFADGLNRLLIPMDAKVVELQRYYQGYLHDSTKVASLLDLWDNFSSDFDLIKDLSTLLQQSAIGQHPFALIARLYSEVNIQLLTNKKEYHSMLTLLLWTLRPILESVEQFVNDGILEFMGDSMIDRVKDLPLKSAEFWFESLKIRDLPISFLKAIAEDVLVSGKSRMVLNECQVRQEIHFSSLYEQFVSAVNKQMGVFESRMEMQENDDPISIFSHLHITSHSSSLPLDLQPSPLLCPNVVSLENVINTTLTSLIRPKRLRIGESLSHTLRTMFNIDHQLRLLPCFCFMMEGEAMSNFCYRILQELQSNRLLRDTSFLDKIFASCMAECSFVRSDFELIKWPIPDKWKSQALSFAIFDDIRSDFQAPWPLSLFISQSILGQFNAVANLLIQLKCVQLGLEKDVVSRDRLRRAELRNNKVEKLRRDLRSRLLKFTQSLASHLFDTVIAGNISMFDEELRSANELDAMILSHRRLVQNVFHQCLLHSRAKPVMTPIRCILKLTYEFTRHYQDLQKVMLQDEELDFLNTSRKKFEEWRQFVVNALRSSRGQQLETLALRLDF